jgi:hypothetical protein
MLRSDPLAIVTTPTADEIKSFVSAVSAKYPALTNCWGAMDGLKIWLERAGYSQVQNIFFNGHLKPFFVFS